MNLMTSRRVAASSLSVLALLVLTACGSNSTNATASSPSQSPPTACVSSPATGDGAVTIGGLTASGPQGSKPTVTVIPNAPVPTSLETKDVYVGDGVAIPAGGTGTWQYTGVSLTTCEVFDSSWDRGTPISFGLNQVIDGWKQGLPGMKVGGRRILVIPSALAYGDDPSSGRPVGPLAFVVDLVSVP